MSGGAIEPLARRLVPVDPEVSVGRLPPVTAAGVTLIKVVLGMVMGSIVILALYLWSADRQQGAAIAQAVQALAVHAPPGQDTAQALAAIAKQLGEQQAAFRAFWLQVAQLVLLNLLLPVLTALLGYIFGTSQVARGQAEE